MEELEQKILPKLKEKLDGKMENREGKWPAKRFVFNGMEKAKMRDSNRIMKMVVSVDNCFLNFFCWIKIVVTNLMLLIQHYAQANESIFLIANKTFQSLRHYSKASCMEQREFSLTNQPDSKLDSELIKLIQNQAELVFTRAELEKHKASFFFELITQCTIHNMEKELKMLNEMKEVKLLKDFLKVKIPFFAYQLLVRGELAIPSTGWDFQLKGSSHSIEFRTVCVTVPGIKYLPDEISWLRTVLEGGTQQRPIDSILVTSSRDAAFVHFKLAEDARFVVNSMNKKDNKLFENQRNENLDSEKDIPHCFGIEPSSLSKIFLKFKVGESWTTTSMRTNLVEVFQNSKHLSSNFPEIVWIDIFEDKWKLQPEKVAIIAFSCDVDAKNVRNVIAENAEKLNIVSKDSEIVSNVVLGMAGNSLFVSNLPNDTNLEGLKRKLKDRFEAIRRVDENEFVEKVKQANELKGKQEQANESKGKQEIEIADNLACPNIQDPVLNKKGTAGYVIFKDYLAAEAAVILLNNTKFGKRQESIPENSYELENVIIKCHRDIPPLSFLTPIQLEQRAVNRIGFLMKDFDVRYWYFEILELVRKLLMSSIVNFVTPGTPTQVLRSVIHYI